MNVFITGINGFLGRELASSLERRGHQISGSVRSLAKKADAPIEKACVLALGEPFDDSMFAGMDALIHCAHDASRGAYELNVQGTRCVAEAASRQRVGLQFFISSYSAQQAAPSEYGRIKWALQNFFLERDLTVLKPGLVIGNGGLFARVYGLVERLPVVPLIDGGRGEVPVVDIRDFTAAVAEALETRTKGLKRLYHVERPTLRQITCEIRLVCGSKSLFVPIPLWLAHAGLWTIERGLRVRLPVGIDNLRGFAANQACDDQSDLTDLVPRPISSLSEMIRHAKPEPVGVC